MNSIKDLSLDELSEYFLSIGEKPFRAKQVFKWLLRGVRSFDEMSDISLELRAKLAEVSPVDNLTIKDIRKSKLDGTRKYLFETKDGEVIETVLMEYYYGYSICISTQAGCRMGCKFCASGMNGLTRSLTPGEILDQFLIVERDVREKADGIGETVRELKHQDDEGRDSIGHIVIMGIGEPFDNYDYVMKFLKNICDPAGRNLGRRQITVSTCGLISGMKRFMKDLPQANLSLSLHAPNDKIREKIMPVNKSAGVDELIAFAYDYSQKTGRRFSFEYALFSGINDSDECARELVGKLKGKGFHVNLIPGNGVPELGFETSSSDRVATFAKILLDGGIRTTTRRELGSDIMAACGQLRAANAL
jgi:23S rRNA (adenine2503-C2)-methyltransferase